MKGKETDAAISKERGLCAAENGDVATVRAFLNQLLPPISDQKPSDPEQAHENRDVSLSKRPCSTTLREIVTAVVDTAIENGEVDVVREVMSSPDIYGRLRAAMSPRREQQLTV